MAGAADENNAHLGNSQMNEGIERRQRNSHALPAHGRPISLRSGAAIDDASCLLQRMDDKMQMLKAIVVKQQSVINDLKSENERLLLSNAKLAKAEETSSEEIARLCEELAESSARADALQQRSRGITHGTFLAAPTNQAPKHIIVDRRAATVHQNSSMAQVDALPTTKTLSIARVAANGGWKAPGATTTTRNAFPRATMGEGESTSLRSECPALASHSSRNGRVVERTRPPACSDSSPSTYVGGFGEDDATHIRITEVLSRPGVVDGSLSGRSDVPLRPVQGTGQRGKAGKTSSSGPVPSLYENSRSAAKLAWGLFKSKPARGRLR